MLYTRYNRCTHRLDAYEVMKMAYTNRFINELVELHTKTPLCPDCGKPMVEEMQGYWACIPCNLTLTDDEINHPIHLDEYENVTLEPNEDYGKFEYDDGRMLEAGVPDWYLFFYQHRPDNI